MLQSVCGRASEKSVLYVTTQLMTVRLKVVSCFGVGGDLVSFNKKLVTEISASQNHAKQGLLVLEYREKLTLLQNNMIVCSLFWSKTGSRTKDRLLKKTHCWLGSADL